MQYCLIINQQIKEKSSNFKLRRKNIRKTQIKIDDKTKQIIKNISISVFVHGANRRLQGTKWYTVISIIPEIKLCKMGRYIKYIEISGTIY